jgi:hypothetical protein
MTSNVYAIKVTGGKRARYVSAVAVTGKDAAKDVRPQLSRQERIEAVYVRVHEGDYDE